MQKVQRTGAQPAEMLLVAVVLEEGVVAQKDAGMIDSAVLTHLLRSPGARMQTQTPGLLCPLLLGHLLQLHPSQDCQPLQPRPRLWPLPHRLPLLLLRGRCLTRRRSGHLGVGPPLLPMVPTRATQQC